MSDKLEALRRRKQEREEARAAELEALECAALELEEKYESDGKKRGVDFEIVTTLIGNFAVRNPDFLLAKKFSDVADASVEDVVQFVVPHVMFPAGEIVRPMFQEHGGVAWRLALALMKMYQAEEGTKRGK